jgi:hypothetical protein
MTEAARAPLAAPSGWRNLDWIAAASVFPFTVMILAADVFRGFPPPRPGESSAEHAEYYTKHGLGILIGYIVFNIGSVFFFFYLGALWKAFRKVEGHPAWLSLILFGAGISGTAMALIGNAVWATAGRMAKEYTISPEIASLYFHLGAIFFIGWIGFVVMEIAGGLLILRTGIFPRWLGWFALATVALWMLSSWPTPRDAGILNVIVFDGTGLVSLLFTLFWFCWIGAILMKRATEDAAVAQRLTTP